MDETKSKTSRISKSISVEDDHSISQKSSKSRRHYSSPTSHDEIISQIKTRPSAMMKASQRTINEVPSDYESNRSKSSNSHVMSETMSETSTHVETEMRPVEKTSTHGYISEKGKSDDGNSGTNNQGRHCHFCCKKGDLKKIEICDQCLVRFLQVTSSSKLSRTSQRSNVSSTLSQVMGRKGDNDQASSKILSEGSEHSEPKDDAESVSSIKTMESFSSHSTNSSIAKQSEEATSSESLKSSVIKDVDDSISPIDDKEKSCESFSSHSTNSSITKQSDEDQSTGKSKSSSSKTVDDNKLSSQDDIVSEANEENSQTIDAFSSHSTNSSSRKQSDETQSKSSSSNTVDDSKPSSQDDMVSEANEEKSQTSKAFSSHSSNSCTTKKSDEVQSTGKSKSSSSKTVNDSKQSSQDDIVSEANEEKSQTSQAFSSHSTNSSQTKQSDEIQSSGESNSRSSKTVDDSKPSSQDDIISEANEEKSQTSEAFSSLSTNSSQTKQSDEIQPTGKTMLRSNKTVDDSKPSTQDDIISGAFEENSQSSEVFSPHSTNSCISKPSDDVQSTGESKSSLNKTTDDSKPQSQDEIVSDSFEEKSQTSAHDGSDMDNTESIRKTNNISVELDGTKTSSSSVSRRISAEPLNIKNIRKVHCNVCYSCVNSIVLGTSEDDNRCPEDCSNMNSTENTESNLETESTRKVEIAQSSGSITKSRNISTKSLNGHKSIASSLVSEISEVAKSTKSHSKSSSTEISITITSTKISETKPDQSIVSVSESNPMIKSEIIEISQKSKSAISSEKTSSETSQTDSSRSLSKSKNVCSTESSVNTKSIESSKSSREQSNVSVPESGSKSKGESIISSSKSRSIMATGRFLKPGELGITSQAESHASSFCQCSESVPIIEIDCEEYSQIGGCICSPLGSKVDSLHSDIETCSESLKSQRESVETKCSEKVSTISSEALPENVQEAQDDAPPAIPKAQCLQCKTEISTDKSNLCDNCVEGDIEHRQIVEVFIGENTSQSLLTASMSRCQHTNIFVNIININQLICDKHHLPIQVCKHIEHYQQLDNCKHCELSSVEFENNHRNAQDSIDKICVFHSNNCCTIERDRNRIIIKVPSFSCVECISKNDMSMTDESHHFKGELEKLHETHAVQLCASCENTFTLLKGDRCNTDFELLSKSADDVKEVFQRIQKILPDCSCSPNCHHDINRVDLSSPLNVSQENQAASHDTISQSGRMPCDSLTQGLLIAQYITDTVIMFKWDVPEIPGIYGYKLFINDVEMHTLKCPSISWTIFEDIPLTSNKIDIKCIMDSDVSG